MSSNRFDHPAEMPVFVLRINCEGNADAVPEAENRALLVTKLREIALRIEQGDDIRYFQTILEDGEDVGAYACKPAGEWQRDGVWPCA